MPRYYYEIGGSAAEGQTWEAKGAVGVASEGDFIGAVASAVASSFKQLTEGKAVYGKPGVGCRGPYKVNALVLVRMEPGDVVPKETKQ